MLAWRYARELIRGWEAGERGCGRGGTEVFWRLCALLCCWDRDAASRLSRKLLFRSNTESALSQFELDLPPLL